MENKPKIYAKFKGGPRIKAEDIKTSGVNPSDTAYLTLAGINIEEGRI